METTGTLEQMWEEHSTYLKRMLISFTRDIDLADDLLQETYIKALGGIGGFRGGDGRAWLAAIAKNTYLAQARLKRFGNETPLDPDLHVDGGVRTDSREYHNLLDLKRAMSELKPDLRTALVMKHYGGFSYGEIGRHLNCPEGTARRRVWTAVQRLKSVLCRDEEETIDMRCEQIRGSKLLDYLYGALPPKQAEAITKHLGDCPGCSAEAAEIRKLMGTLNRAEGDFKLTRIIEIDEEGMPTEYSWWSMMNNSDYARGSHWFTTNKDQCLDYVTLQGQEATYELFPLSEKQYWIETVLPEPLQPGEARESVTVFHPLDEKDWAQKLENGNRRFLYGTTPNSGLEWVMVMAIRLPAGVKLVSAVPEPTEIKTNGKTTLIWRKVLPKITSEPPPGWTSEWQFECSLEYQQKDSSKAHDKPKIENPWDSPCVFRAPDIVWNVCEAWDGNRDHVLQWFHEYKDQDLPYQRAWFGLGYMLYEKGHYDEAMQAFDKAVAVPRPPWIVTMRYTCLHGFTSLVWQGHILDILGRREEALAKYRAALEYHPDGVGGGWLNGDYCGIKIDREWVEERLKMPFNRG